MRFFYFLTPFLFLLFSVSLFGQCPPPGFPNSGSNCGNPIICENLDGYCNTINNNNQSRAYPCCTGWQLNNDEWFGFFAGSTTITIEITPSNCSPGGQQGLQAAIYDNCPAFPPPAGWCTANLMDAQCSCEEDPFILTATDFIIGEVYWFVIDGCAGNVCDYSIDVTEGSTIGFAPDNPGPVTGPTPVCQASTSNYELPPVNGATVYTWTLSPASAGTINGNDDDISVTWAAGFSGDATLCVKTSNLCYSNPTQSCITIHVVKTPTAALTGTGVICNGSGGSVNLTVTFTGEPDWRFVYSINGVAQAPITTSSNPYTITTTQPGTYALVSVVSLAVDPPCTGTVSGSFVVTEITLVPTSALTAAHCGTADGAVNLSISGGNAPYTYIWSGGETSQDLSNVPPGTYTVTVTDNNGCTKTHSATVSDIITTPVLTTVITNNTNCTGGNGAIDLSVTPAGSPTYAWSGGQTTQDLSGLIPGTYTVTVTQGITCSATGSYTVADNPLLPNVTATPTNSSCDFSNGSVNASPSGGASPYTFSWSNGATTEDLSNVLAGTYTLTVTGANGCTRTVSATVNNVNPTLTLTAAIVTNTDCSGGNGSINLTVAPPNSYTFIWSNAATTEDLTDVFAGTYTVTVSAGGTCTASNSFTVADNPLLPNATAVPANTSCDFSNGSINGGGNGGEAPYTFAWSNGATTEDLANIPAGTYTLTVTGANGCTRTVSATVNNVNPTLTLTATTVTNTDCSGGNGSINLTVTPANNYTFIWSNAATTEDLTDVFAGTYTVTVSAGGTCTASNSFTVADNPLLPNATAVPANTSCDFSNGSINGGGNGGEAPYTFAWSNGATTEDLANIPAGTYTLTVTGANGCTRTISATVNNVNPTLSLTATTVANTDCTGGNGSINLTVAPPNSYTFTWSNGDTTEDLTNVLAGTYIVTVSAGGTCTASNSFTVANNPLLPTASATPTSSSCNLANGSINGTPSGGEAPYTYAWSNGATTEDLANILAGTYTLTVTGANGCTRTISANVNNVNPTITLSATTVANTSCVGGNGSINLTVAPPNSYTFTWSNGATTEDISSLPAGPYTVTVSAGGTCTAQNTFTVADGPNFPIPSAVPMNTSCDLANGSINGGASGGVPPYTFSWSNGATTEDLANIPAGTYTLTVTAANGCTRTIQATVNNVNPTLTLTATTVANTLCVGGNGSINLSVTPPNSYTFTWSNGATTEDLANVPPGSYTVTVSAGGTCTAQNTFTVNDVPNLPNATAAPTNSSCDLANGSVNGGASGGVAPYTFAWSNGATTEDLANVLAGTYTLTVTGANGCTRTVSVTVNNVNPTLTLSATTVANTVCVGGNGSINLSVSPPNSYTFNWSNGATTEDLANLPPGSYTVTVSAGGTCTAQNTFTVNDMPNLPTPTATPTNTSCDFSNGSINGGATGGVAPYTFAWSNGATTEDLANIPAGAYTLTVTGANGCTNTINVVVNNVNPPINLSATAMPNTVCNASPNGSINMTVAPAGSYTFTWSNGATTEDLSGVASGPYTVTVSAGGSCTQVASFNVPDNPNVPNISQVITNTSCDFANGAINVSINGGPTPYTYTWSNGATTQDLANLLAGNYSLTVTSPNGCTDIADLSVVNINPPINLSGNVQSNTSCNSSNTGSIDLVVQPVGNYTYTWSNGSTTQDLNNIPQGDYSVTVSAGGSCTEVFGFNVPFDPNLPNPSLSFISANCGLPNGSINLSVSGGVLPYSYAWNSGQTTQDLVQIPAGLYVVTITGANGCTASDGLDLPDDVIPVDIDANVMGKTSCIANNGSISLIYSPANASIIWSTGSTSANLVALAPGDYTVTVSAGGTCTSSATYTVDDISELPIVTADILPALCTFPIGEVNLSVDFGIPPYRYDWAHIPGTMNQEDLTNLPAGNYVVTVTTSMGCSEVFFAPVDNDVVAIELTALPFDDVSCTSNNGFIDLDANPILNYTYDWAHIPGANNPQDLVNLSAGNYSVTVTFGSCNANASFEILDLSIPPSVSISPSPAICGQNNGMITLNVTGATPPYNFNWAQIPGNNNPQNLSNLAPGTYTVTVTDFFDCTATASTTVVNNVIAVNISGIPAANTSCAAPNGGLNISVLPAGTNFNYIWSNAATTQDLTGISPGLYTVTVSAGVGCSSVATFQVPNNSVNPQLSASVIAAICSQSNGSIDITTTSGTTPYLFVWSNAATTEDLANIPPGNYSLTVTDANSCTAETILNVANNASTFSLGGSASPYSDCASVNGSVNLSVTPAGPYTYLWSNGETTQDLSGLTEGTYTVQVTEQGTCIASATYFVLNTLSYPTLNQNVVAELCNLLDGSVDITLFGGLAPFNYTWQSGQTTQDLNNIGGGTYNLTVTGANNCTETITAVVPENSVSFSLAGTPVPNSSCIVLNGSIDLNITPAVPSGGPGYTYAWSSGLNTQDLNGIPPGTYNVTVSAGGTCTNTASFTVADDAGSPSISEGVTDALCGQSSGSINLTINSGAAPYSFIWSNGATTEDLAELPGGNYAVTVTGSNGCVVTGAISVTDGIIIPTLSGIPQPNTACVGPNGSVNLSISPGSLTYSILWSNGATTQNLDNLTSGTYTVVVNGGGACIASATYNVGNATVAVTAGGTDLDILCFGDNTGAINLILNGGTQPFDFNWNPNTIGNVEDPGSLTAGIYGVTVTDAVGCTTTASFNISQPAAAVQAVCTPTGLVTQPGFTDGKAQVSISGGTAPYSILWSPGGTQSGIPAGNFPLNNLGVGTYAVTVTDANGCTAICGFAIGLTSCATAVGDMGSAQISLCGIGCITANYDALNQILDPNDVLQFILHEGPDSLIVNEKLRSSQPTFCFNPFTMQYGKTYYISAVVGNNDGSGNVVLAHYCTVIATGTPIVFYEKPVASAAIPKPITCITFQVAILGSSNLPNSTFLWSTLNGSIVGASNQADIQANDAGDYRLIIANNGCLDTTIAVVLDIRNDPEAKIIASPDDVLDCIINEIVLVGEVEGSGGANAIWFNQNGQSFPGNTTLQIQNPGTYWFAIVDTVTFCTDTASIVIGENQLYPPLFINPPGTLTCSIGSVPLSGGSPLSGILLEWAIINGQDTSIIGTGTTLTVTQANTYWIFGYDPINGCNNALSAVVLADQTYPTANAGQPFNIDCFGQTASLTGSATGGSGTLVYAWTTSGGVILTGATTLTPTISEPGTYTLLVTSSGNSCSDTDVVVIAPNEPTAIPTVDNPLCLGHKGTILIDTVLGAKPPIQYTLTGGPHVQSGNLFSNLAPGAYSIFIEDANGCTTSVDAEVLEPPVFEVTVEPQATIELGDSYLVGATVNVPDNQIESIQWTPTTWLSCDTCLSTRIDIPLHSQLYHILVVSTAGCRDDAPFLLRVDKQVNVYIPNIFSPNDDGDNDGFTVYADLKGVKQVKLFQIYSRWGEQLFVRENFQPNDPTLGWDGRFRGQDMNPAVFVYYAVVEFIDGQEVLFKGDVTVKR